MQQPPLHTHPAGGGWVHGLIHGTQLFAIAFAVALGLKPGSITRDAIVAAVIAGVRAIFAAGHH